MKKAFFFLVFTWISFGAIAQDPHFTQYFSNPLYLNPAFAGSAGCSRITAQHRDHWPRIWGTYSSSSISYDQYVHPIRSGVGFQFLFDKKGDILYHYYSRIFYSPAIPIGEYVVIRPAFSASLGVRHFYWKRLTFSGQWDDYYIGCFPISINPHELPEKFQCCFYSASAGLLITYRNITIGCSGDHLNRPDIGFWSYVRQPIRYTIHFSAQFDIQESANITPSIIYMKDPDDDQLLMCISARAWYLNIGTGFRFDAQRGNFDHIFGLLGFQNKWMSLGYSYDFGVPGLYHTPDGAHELTMMFKFNCKNKTDKFPLPRIGGF